MNSKNTITVSTLVEMTENEQEIHAEIRTEIFRAQHALHNAKVRMKNFERAVLLRVLSANSQDEQI